MYFTGVEQGIAEKEAHPGGEVQIWEIPQVTISLLPHFSVTELIKCENFFLIMTMRLQDQESVVYGLFLF